MKKSFLGMVALGLAAAGTAFYLYGINRKRRVRGFGAGQDEVLLMDGAEDILDDYGSPHPSSPYGADEMVDVDNHNDLEI